MKLPERPSGAVAAASVAAAYGAFAAVFRGPRARFWPRMTRTGLGLGALALATEGDLRRIVPRPRDVALGIGIAAGLYGVFQVGDRVARVVMPKGAEDIGDIYQLRSLRPKGEIAARDPLCGECDGIDRTQRPSGKKPASGQ